MRNQVVSKNWTLDEWIALGRVGVSSKTMWTALKGIPVSFKGFHHGIPHDPDDFSRCYKLVKHCNVSKEDLQLIADRVPQFKPFIDNWDRLCELYEEMRAQTHTKGEMYNFMQTLMEKDPNQITIFCGGVE